MASTVKSDEFFWPTIFKEIDEFNNSNSSVNMFEFNEDIFNAPNTKNKNNSSLLNESRIQPFNETFIGRLRICLFIQAKYKEIFRQLRDSLGGIQALSRYPSMSSVPTSDSLLSKDVQNTIAINSKKTVSIANVPHSHQSHTNKRNDMDMNKHQGILMSEEEIIFGHMDTFCERIRCVLEEIISLAQFQLLFKASPALARPKREDLRYKDFQAARQYRRNSQKSLGNGEIHNEDEDVDEEDDDECDEEDEDDDIEEEGENEEDKEQGDDENNDQSFENKDETDGFMVKSSEHIDVSKGKSQLNTLHEEEDKQRKSLLSTSKPNKLTRYENQYEVIHEVEQSENNDDQKESQSLKKAKNNHSSATTLHSESRSFHNLKEKSALSFNEPKETKETKEADSMVQQTERLFETENRIEEDSKNILQKAQTISKEDIKIMSN
jgi:hypothetical protein